MFRFAHPQYLWLLAALPVMIVLYIWAAYDCRRRLARFGAPRTVRCLIPDASPRRRRLKFILLCTAFVFAVLAAARPQLGSRLREEHAEGIEMMIAVDISNSMLAEDFQPNRLERTKYAIGKLFEGLKQDRVGLVVFAGEAKVQLPITSDLRMARAFARKIDPALVSVQGTDITEALSTAMLSFSGSEGAMRSRALILITDGENHEGDVTAAAERAAEQGIRIFTIGIGTPEGAPIKIGGEYIRDENGDMVVSKLDESLLQKLADLTGGAYVRATSQDVGLEGIVDEINRMEKAELGTIRFEEYDERYRPFLAIALALLLLEFTLLDRKNPLLAHLNIFNRREE